MDFRTAQGLHSSTFSPPPDAGEGFNILTVHDFHAKHNPNHPVFRYMADDHQGVKTIFWNEAVRAFYAASLLVRAMVKTDAINPVISILASLDPITYFALIEGIMRAGCTPFPISTRNSDIAIAHLLRTTDSQHLFVSPDIAMQELAAKACSRLVLHGDVNEKAKQNPITIISTPVFEDLFQEQGLKLESSTIIETERTAIILHSSGSTSAFPKPIGISHRDFLSRGKAQYYGEFDYCGEIMSIAGVPMYHAMGLDRMLEMALTGMTLVTFPPSNPPLIPTPENVFHAAVTTKSTLICTVPSFLEEWAKDPKKVGVLEAFKRVHVGGGTLVTSVGDILVGQGVKVILIYASTEVGPMMEHRSQIPPEGWNYFTLGATIDPFLVPSYQYGQNTYRLIVKKCKTRSPAVFNTTVDGQPAFDTNDLLVRHPINANLFRMYGRADEQIKHSTGEMTNPGPIERLLLEDRKIAHAIVFGREKFQAGVLISPSSDLAFDPEDLDKLSEYRNLIWETVLHATKDAPQHSKIIKELIVVVNPSKPLQLTAKGTLRRQVSLDAYHDEIENAYEALEVASQPEIKAPTTWDLKAVENFVSEVVIKSLGFKVDEHDSIFQVGADSLIATYIRNTIIRGLRDTSIVSASAIQAIPRNFIYDNPSIASLCKSVFDIANSNVSFVSNGNEIEGEQDEPDPEAGYQWPKMGQPGQTILQVRKGKGEPPLIIIHGAGGNIDVMAPLQEKFRSALWFVQGTPDLPKVSLRGDAAYYYHKMKELRPHGPYRLATYSGTHLLGFLIAEMMLKNGDELIQLSLIDHTPSMMFSGLLDSLDAEFTGKFDITGKDFRERYQERMIYGLFEIGAREDRSEVQKVFMRAWQGLPSPDHYNQMAQTAKAYMDRTWDFIAQLPGYQDPTQSSWEKILFAVEKWLKGITLEIPVTVYVASKGVLANVQDPLEREKWSDLGIRRCFPDSRVIHVEAGHASIVWNETVIKDLERGYLTA
ncbi:hypothetical protein BDP27DRAFT_1330220, partial [Rhodocollybia butyracea]